MQRHDNSPAMNQWGYTLIELMIVIAVIGILASVGWARKGRLWL